MGVETVPENGVTGENVESDIMAGTPKCKRRKKGCLRRRRRRGGHTERWNPEDRRRKTPVVSDGRHTTQLLTKERKVAPGSLQIIL